MNRVEIKRKAREIIQGNIWNILKPFLVIFLITFIGTRIITYFPASEETRSLLVLIFEFAIYPLTFGAYVYVMKLIRNIPYEINDMFKHYDKFIYIFALYFLIGLFVALWTLLLIIPGIIAALSYMMATYIMIDGNDDPMECISHSKKMMYGYKWDYFKFNFSFFWWILLAIPTLGLALIYVIPYIITAQILYYEELKKITKLD